MHDACACMYMYCTTVEQISMCGSIAAAMLRIIGLFKGNWIGSDSFAIHGDHHLYSWEFAPVAVGVTRHKPSMRERLALYQSNLCTCMWSL